MARIGRWELLERAGEGSTASVWKARDEQGRAAALKLLRDQRLDDADAQSRVRQEIRILAALDHPNVARLLDHGEVHEVQVKRSEPVRRLWFAVEWVDGGDLEGLVAARVLPCAEVARIGSEIASALGAAHALGIVHRDLSPRNVRVTTAGAVKLIDFGLAKVLPEGGAELGVRTLATGIGDMLGTAAWLAPEMLEGGAVDSRTDIHALGALLFWLATGRQPFEGGNVLLVLQAIRSPVRPRPSAAGSRCGEVFDALVTACLALDPNARPESAAEVGRVLRDVGKEQ